MVVHLWKVTKGDPQTFLHAEIRATEPYVLSPTYRGAQGARDVALRIKWMARQAAQKRQRAAAEAAQEDRRQTGRARGQSIFAVPPRPGPPPAAPATATAADRLPTTAGAMPHPPLYQQTPGAPQHQYLGGSGGAAAAAAPSAVGAATAAPTMMLDDHGSGTVGGIGGPIGQLLDSNQSILLQFKDNMRMYKVRRCLWLPIYRV